MTKSRPSKRPTLPGCYLLQQIPDSVSGHSWGMARTGHPDKRIPDIIDIVCPRFDTGRTEDPRQSPGESNVRSPVPPPHRITDSG